MNLSSVDVVFLRSVGVVLLDISDLLFDGVFDFIEHVLKVREHFFFIIIKFCYFFIIQIQSYIIQLE